MAAPSRTAFARISSFMWLRNVCSPPLILGNFRTVNTLPHATVEKHRKSKLAYDMQESDEPKKKKPPSDLKYAYPDFMPNPNWYYRDRISEKLERRDMWKRRQQINLPEFYPGSILSVTASDPYAPNKTNRFVGICLAREGYGLRSTFILRNHIDGLGIEIEYDLYNPTLKQIQVLLLEKRLDDNILYLRNCDPKHSTIPFDMDAVPHPPGQPVPVNDTKIQLNPLPWDRRWDLWGLKGVLWPELPDKFVKRSLKPMNVKPWLKYDLMHAYRKTINREDEELIMSDVLHAKEQNDKELRSTRQNES